jgi:hypothetical protein
MDALKARDAYVALARAHTVHDELFFFDELRASLIVDVLNFGPKLSTAARLRWSGDGTFAKNIASWLPKGEGRVVFVGIYARGFKAADFSLDGSYRVRLRDASGTREPDHIEEVREPLLGYYLPVFNHWEKVFACHFPADPNASGATLILDFPQGARELTLAEGG